MVPFTCDLTLDETCLFITVIYIKLSYTIPQFNNLIDILNNIKLQRLISQIWYRNKHTRKHSGGVIRTFILPVYLLMHDSEGVIGTLISQIRYCTETNTVEGWSGHLPYCAHDSGGNMTVEGCLVYSQLYLLIHDSGGMIGTFTVTYYILCYDSGWGDRDIWELHEQSSPFQQSGITT